VGYKIIDGLLYIQDDKTLFQVSFQVGVAKRLDFEPPSNCVTGQPITIQVMVKDFEGTHQKVNIPVGVSINEGEEVTVSMTDGIANIEFVPEYPGTYLVKVRPKDETHEVRGGVIKEVYVSE